MTETQLKGNITEQKCILKWLENGFTVSKPIFDNARYDIIVERNNKLFRIQIKTSTWKDKDCTAFSFNGYSQHNTGKGNKRMKYTSNEIDYFMTEKNNVFYLYPAQKTGFAEKTLRLVSTTTAKTNNSQINWAKDFMFEEVIKNF